MLVIVLFYLFSIHNDIISDKISHSQTLSSNNSKLILPNTLTSSIVICTGLTCSPLENGRHSLHSAINCSLNYRVVDVYIVLQWKTTFPNKYFFNPYVLLVPPLVHYPQAIAWQQADISWRCRSTDRPFVGLNDF